MALTVNSAFNSFNKDYVNLDPDRTNVANGSRDWLFGQLNNLSNKDKLFPIHYQDRDIKFGSFARKTKIRELDDIDLMFCLSADGAYYSQNILEQNKYEIHTEASSTKLQNLSDNNLLNSRKLVNKLVGALANIEHYKSADIHRKGEAATLNLSSYEWVFDIVPCFFTVNDFYLIPDGNGNWKATDPRIDQNRVTNINQQHMGKILQIIRTLKYWNRRNSSHTISSYIFETLILDYFSAKNSIHDYIDFNIRDFWSYLVNAIYYPINDPKGFQGDMNSFSYIEKQSISEKANCAYTKAREAIYAETNDKNQSKAISLWQDIFGGDFPSYG